MIEIRRTADFSKWMDGLRDGRAQRVIAARIDRLAHGNPGDVSTGRSRRERIANSLRTGLPGVFRAARTSIDRLAVRRR